MNELDAALNAINAALLANQQFDAAFEDKHNRGKSTGKSNAGSFAPKKGGHKKIPRAPTEQRWGRFLRDRAAKAKENAIKARERAAKKKIKDIEEAKKAIASAKSAKEAEVARAALTEAKEREYTPYTPDIADEDLRKPDPYFKSDTSGHKHKMIPFSKDNPPDWLKKMILDGDTPYFSTCISNLTYPEEGFPNKSNLLYVGVKNTAAGKEGNLPKYTEEHVKNLSKIKFNLVDAIQAKAAEMEAKVVADAKAGRNEAICALLTVRTGIRADSREGGFVKARYRKGKLIKAGYHSYGASSIKRSHVTISDGLIKIDFIGKAGKRNIRFITNDPALSHKETHDLLKRFMQQGVKATEENKKKIKGLREPMFYDPLLFARIKGLYDKASGPNDRLFPGGYSALGKYTKEVGAHIKVPEIHPHNYRHMIANQMLDIFMDCAKWKRDIPKNLDDYKRMVTGFATFVGDVINDTPGPVINNYLMPEKFQWLKDAVKPPLTFPGIMPPGEKVVSE